MQRILFTVLFACALLGASCGTAQDVTTNTDPTIKVRRGAADRGTELDAEIKELGLSEAQATTYREIDNRYVKQQKELRRSAAGNRQEMLAAGGKLRATREREIFDLLNGEQRQKYTALLDRRKENMRKRQRVVRPGGR